MNPEIPPLPADPARQAEAMLRACEYQILQTVSAWLDLRDDEVIFVEGSEDFDKVSLTEAEAIQVKTSPDPISLGQKEIQETLNNYWKLRQAVGGWRVRLRYLTCAPITVERGSPFGVGIAGLEIWQRRPLSDGEAMQLATFLGQQPRLDASFRRWLLGLTPEELRIELVERVNWQTQAEEAHFVERSIHCKLAVFAEKRGSVPASVTKQVTLRLIEEVWKTLRNPAPRRLDFFRLEELWEEVTRVSIPRSALDARWSESGVRQPAPSSAPVELLRKGTPPLPGTVAHRSKLVEQWRASLSLKGVLNVHGSTRTGKTTLAKLIALPDADNWMWWSGARMRSEEIQRALSMLVPEVARSPGAVNLVLDDLDFSPIAAHGMEENLGELLALVNGRRGRVLITSQKPIPGRLQHAFGIDTEQIVLVPRLDQSEVAELAAALGCIDTKQRSIWARIVRASTEGHPQLTAVRLLALKRQGWPSISLDTFDSGIHAIHAEKADARQLLEGLPEPQRELLQRLSVFPVAFRRDHAIGLGAALPPLVSPGSVFDPLVGPWVEPLHEGYFALSPLLAGGAREALAPSEFDKLQNKAAMVLLTTEPRTTLEGANAFMLFWQARNGGMLIQLVANAFQMEADIFSAFAEELWWFTLASIELGERLYARNALISLSLRWLQFRIAVSAAPTSAPRIVQAWRWELLNSKYPEPALQRMLFAGEVLPRHQVPLRATVVVELFRDVAEAVDAHPEMPWPHMLPKGETEELDYVPHWEDVISTLSFLSSARCENVDYLDEFLSALESTEPELRGRILRGFVGGGIEAQLAVDRVWLAESEKQVPDWPRCLQVFKNTLLLGRTWNCRLLATAAMRGICVVLDEYVKDHRAAHRVLDQIVAGGGVDAHVVHDRRAAIFFSEKNYAAAEEQWRLALSAWPRELAPFDTGAAFAARSAGISAARQERWLIAADWFMEIIERVPTKSETAFMAGAYADAGYCLWRAGESHRGLHALIEAWRLAETLPLGREDLRAFITRKTIGHIIVWLHGTATRDGVVHLDEPVVGMCSSAEMPEKMRELPETENANVWLFLMRLERELNAGTRAAESGQMALLAATNPVTQSLVSMEAISQILQAGDVTKLPTAIIALARAVRTAAATAPETLASTATRIPPEIFEKTDAARGAAAFLAGLVAAQARGDDWRKTLGGWRLSLPGEAGDGWLDWFDTIEDVLGGTVEDARTHIRNPSSDWAKTLLAAWYVLLSDDASPEDIFIAHARWLGEVRCSPWLRETAIAFCHQVEIAWMRVTRRPALLRQPRLNVPAIVVSCREAGQGLSKAARILLAASPAVSVRMGPEMESVIRALATQS